MRLAVVIPVYNHARFVARTLESVLAQSRRPDRIIVIDDGSTDESLAVCQTFASRGVEVMAQENQGVAATARRLIDMAAADCDLIATLDSDDVLPPTRFETCTPVFENDPAARLLVTGLRMIDENDQPLEATHPRRRWMEAVWSRWEGPATDLVAWLGQANFAVSNSNFLARREFLQTHQAKPYRFSYDYHLLIRAALDESLRVVAEPLLDYRVHGGNTMNTQPAALIRELVRLGLDLHHDLAAGLMTDPSLRGRFQRFMRASWHNVSALHAGVLQSLLAHCAAAKSPDELAALAAALDAAAWPELATFPNREAVNLFEPGTPLSPAAGAVSEKLASLRRERDEARAQAEAHRDLARLRHQLLASRWIALGRTLGLARGLDSDAGKSPVEKLAALRAAVARSAWCRLGGGQEYHLPGDLPSQRDDRS